MPRHSARVYRRRRLVVFSSLTLVVGLTSGLIAVANAPLPAATVSASVPLDLTSAPAELSVPPFGVTAISAEGYGILSGDDLDTPRPIASIAKVVAALVILDARPISDGGSGESITFDAEDVAQFNSSVANAESRADVVEGATISQRDALTTMLVVSANNYAWTLTRWAFGSQDAYLTAAGDWLARHNLFATTIADASGLNPATVSSPRDLLEIGRLALSEPVISGAVSTVSVEIAPPGLLENTNDMLGVLGINGIKTGTTDEAGACLLFSADLPVGDTSVNVVGVVLAAPTHDDLDTALESFLTSVQEGFRQVSVTRAGESLASATTKWGSNFALVSTEAITELVWSDTPVLLELPAQVSSTGPIDAAVGTAVVRIGEAQRDIVVTRTSSAEDPGLAWRIGHLGDLVAVP